MRLTYKYRIAANKATLSKAERWLDLCRLVYNCALSQRIMWYRQGKKSISAYDQNHQLVEAKTELPELKEVNAQTIREPINRLDLAFNAFFRRIKQGDKAGFPRFKGKNRYDSFTFPDSGYKLDGRYLIISKLGTFKLKLSRPIQGEIKTLTIRKSQSNKWYACFSCDNVPLKPLPKTNSTIGIDVGLMSFLTTSKGTKIKNPRFFKKAKDSLAMRQQRLSRRVKGSNRRRKARILVAKAHDKVRSQRRDFHFKVANQLLKENDVIAIENMKSWNNKFNLSMRDASWFGFFSILKAKAVEAGREIVEVPAKDTSQLCSQCGTKVPKELYVRVHSCPVCNLSIDRDFNAAINIYKFGQNFQASNLIIPVLQ